MGARERCDKCRKQAMTILNLSTDHFLSETKYLRFAAATADYIRKLESGVATEQDKLDYAGAIRECESILRTKSILATETCV